MSNNSFNNDLINDGICKDTVNKLTEIAAQRLNSLRTTQQSAAYFSIRIGTNGKVESILGVEADNQFKHYKGK